ncbi:MAG: alpha/beta hydrolase-fold protein [Thermonemataceae bacterium]
MTWKSAFCQAYHCTESTIYSEILGEDRKITICFPEVYKPSDRLDVLYVVDGEMLLKHLLPIMTFLQINQLATPQLIVGIRNRYKPSGSTRNRDLTPIRNPSLSTSGEADQFLYFIEKELISYIDVEYPNTQKRTLIGHSYGGLFTLYTFLVKPYLFDAFVASDPSCYYQQHYISTIAATHLKEPPATRKTLFIGGRAGQQYEDMGITRFVGTLQKQASSKVIWQNGTYKDEHNGSVRFKCFYDGLKFTFFGQHQHELEFHPMGGILQKGNPITVKTYSDHALVRYTTDGTIPTRQSLQFQQTIAVTSPTKLVVKLFANRGDDQVVKATFAYGEAPEPLHKTNIFKRNGLHVKIYPTTDEDSLKRSLVTPTHEHFAEKQAFQTRSLALTKKSTAVFEGFLEVQEAGYYIFYLSTREAVHFYLSGQSLLSYQKGIHRFESNSFIVPLKKGFYPLKVVYRQKEQRGGLSIRYTTPSMSPEQDPIFIPHKLLWYE